jgi:hypothetical protein
MIMFMFMVTNGQYMFMIMIMYILWIQVDRLNPVDTSESSNSRPKGFSVARGQGDPWSVWYRKHDGVGRCYLSAQTLLRKNHKMAG